MEHRAKIVLGVCEAKRRMAELVDGAILGEEVIITKWGKPVVRLEGVPEREEVRLLPA